MGEQRSLRVDEMKEMSEHGDVLETGGRPHSPPAKGARGARPMMGVDLRRKRQAGCGKVEPLSVRIPL